jgi:hypothetical protein
VAIVRPRPARSRPTGPPPSPGGPCGGPICPGRLRSTRSRGGHGPPRLPNYSPRRLPPLRGSASPARLDMYAPFLEIACVERAAVAVIHAGGCRLAAAAGPRHPGDGLTGDLIRPSPVAATLRLLLASLPSYQAVVLNADPLRKRGLLQPEGGEDGGGGAATGGLERVTSRPEPP